MGKCIGIIFTLTGGVVLAAEERPYTLFETEMNNF
jgi:hypothetical protein